MFNSRTALYGFLEQTKGLKREDIQVVELSSGRIAEEMWVAKSAPTVPIGYVTVTDMGLRAGVGREWRISARPA